MRRSWRWLLVLCAFVLLAGAGTYHAVQRFADAPLAIVDDEPHLQVAPGSSLLRIVGALRARNATDQPVAFWRLLAWHMGIAQKLHAGEYRLEPGLTPRGLLRRMARGEVVQYRFTLVEGWDFRQLKAALQARSDLQNTLQGLSDAEIMRRIDAAAPSSPEGRFLPETYAYTRGARDIDLLRRAYRDMQTALEAAWAQRDRNGPLRTPEQLLILASIVEKETGRADERPRIAGVFARRLEKGMRLQTDPTVIYGLGETFDGNLTRRHLETDTPYNTYLRAGLPPTPIAMPGKDALHASARPADGDALYFVARGDGSHHFSANLAEHLAAVSKYQLGR